ncbi:MAG: hypothetical protein R6U25_03285, partial [Alkalispirochaeta sp.]
MTITNARLRGREGLWSIETDGALIAAVRSAEDAAPAGHPAPAVPPAPAAPPAPAGETIDAA